MVSRMIWEGYELEKQPCRTYITLLSEGEANEESYMTESDCNPEIFHLEKNTWTL